MARAVIVNADDFGQSAGINRGIIEAHARGIVTSASLMVHGAAAADAAGYARAHPSLSVGLHIDLGEWVCRDGQWAAIYERVDRYDLAAAEAAIDVQLSLCRRLLGRDPTHLDSHQHVHLEEPVRAIVTRLGAELGVPVRHHLPHLRYEGRFYGQTRTGGPWHSSISPASLIALLRALPEGVTEIGCHPGYATDVVTMYCAEREIELDALCHPDVRRFVCEEGIDLIAFGDVRAKAC